MRGDAPSVPNPTALLQPSPVPTAPHYPSELTSEDHDVPPAAEPPRAPSSLTAASEAAGSWHRRTAPHGPAPPPPRSSPLRPVPLLGGCPTASVVIDARGGKQMQICTATTERLRNYQRGEECREIFGNSCVPSKVTIGSFSSKTTAYFTLCCYSEFQLLFLCYDLSDIEYVWCGA